MLKLGREDVNKIYMGKSPIQKMYLGKTLVFPNEEAAECYAITPSIAQYDGDYPWVWVEDTEKWYRLNNYDEYEPYGIYGDSIEPDIIETTDYYNCAFNGGSNYEVVSSQTSGVNYYMKVEFTTPESITAQSFLFGTRMNLIGTSVFGNAFAAGLFPEGDTGIVLKFQTGVDNLPVGELQPSTKYVGEFQIVKTDTTARTTTYAIYNEVGEVVYSGNRTTVSYTGLALNMMIGALYSTTTMSKTSVSLPYSGEMSRFTIKKSSIDIPNNYDWEDVCDVVFTNENGTIVPVNLYSTDITIASGAGNTATLTDKAGEFKTIIKGEPTYKGKLSIVDGTEYEWDGSRWVIVQSKTYEPREAPEKILYFDSIEEMLSYECVYEGAIAVVGDAAYTYKNNIWRPADYSKAIRYTTTNGNKLDIDVAGSIANLMINGVGYYLFDDVPTSITDNTFSGQTALKTIDLPEGVASIGSSFISCTNLTSVTIPDSVITIGDSAFSGCTNLTSVAIPNSVTSIGKSAFYQCSGITSIVIPNSVTKIGDSAFGNCRYLTGITIPNSVTSFGSRMFYWCPRLISIEIPDSVTSIGVWTFANCNALRSVTIPNSVKSIGENAFVSCWSLTSITIPDSVTSIGKSAFGSCSSLTSITIPDSVTSIGNTAFSGCSGLTSVVFVNAGRLTSIGTSAFQGCSKLAVMRVPHINIDFNISFSTAFTREALVDIIDDLDEPETGARTLTMGETNLAKLTEDDIARALSNRWILQ